MDHLSAVDDLSEARAVPVEGDASSWTWGEAGSQWSTSTHLHLQGLLSRRLLHSQEPQEPVRQQQRVKNRTPRSQLRLMYRNPDTPTDGGGASILSLELV